MFRYNESMRKSKCDKICSCGNPMVLYGKTKNGKQKYRCKSCQKVITENIKYTLGRKAKRLFELLYTIIQEDISNAYSLNCRFKDTIPEEDIKKLNKVYFSKLDVKNSKYPILCKNPKLLISVSDKNDLIIYKIPSVKPDKNGHSTFTITDKEDYKVEPENNPRYYRYESR